MKTLLALVFVLATATPALADPATHSVRLWSEDTTGDSPPGIVNPVCRLRGELRNLQTIASPPISVTFWHPHPGVDDLTAAALSFDALSPGASVETDFYVNGLRCREVRIARSEARFKARGLPFIKIRVSPLRSPRLRAQILFAEREP